ncbi:MAG: TetR family transcriptional regulator [Acidimicrobiales bacterium]
MRRVPRQQRSRDRVDAILAAAHGLVVEAGSDAMRMSDVAARAGVPIGSVYQYFPDKAAILRELAVRFMVRVRQVLAAGLADLGGRDEAIDRVDDLLAAYHALFVSEPDIRDLWAATQSDKELQQLDVEDSRANAGVLYDALVPFAAAADHDQLRDVAFLFTHLAGTAARLAIAVGPAEGERLMAELRGVVRLRLDQLLAADGTG